MDRPGRGLDAAQTRTRPGRVLRTGPDASDRPGRGPDSVSLRLSPLAEYCANAAASANQTQRALWALWVVQCQTLNEC